MSSLESVPFFNTENNGADYTRVILGTGIDPCYSGFQVQGAATAPTGMTPSDTPNVASSQRTIL